MSARDTGTPRRARAAPLAAALAAALAAVATFGATTVTADEAIVVGGGHSPLRSEAQIELNAGWIRRVLERAGLPVRLYYTDGDAPGVDVVSIAPDDEPSSALEPLARAFGDLRAERTRRRQHRLGGVAGPTDRDSLVPALAADLAAADAAEEPVLLVYNGHGSQSSDGSPASVSLDLWRDTSLHADELHALLDGHRSPVRWVFTQCYSGGFHRLAYADPHAGIDLAETRRCGFTAESAYRLAEGCSASIETDDYRDYSTYLFAALDGRERDGDVLSTDPDTNSDGVVTPREAHLYALGHAWSSDLSRSTSEDFLETWQPWWLRWLPPPARVPENEYARLYRDVAARVGIALEEGPRAVRVAMRDVAGRTEALQRRREMLRDEEERLGGALVRAAAERWPELLGPYTEAYRRLVASGGIEEVAASIAAAPQYAALVAAQDADAALDAELVELEREAVQLAKLLRFRRLATLVGQLATHGGDDERAAFAELVECESMPLRGGTSSEAAAR